VGIISGGGGGGGPAAGTYWPAAAPSGTVLDTTTYDNEITGSGKMSVLVFPEDTAAIAFAIDGDDFPRFIIGSDLSNAGLGLGDGTFDPVGGGVGLFITGGLSLGFNGYTPPAQVFSTRELITGNNVNIANAAGGTLTWDTAAGTALMDLTDPTGPAFLAAGIFALAVQVTVSALTAGGYFVAQLTNDADAATVTAFSPAATAVLTVPSVSLSLTRYFAFGTKLTLQVTNFDGAAARDFHIISVSVQRIT
jgi:hypothetical protein